MKNELLIFSTTPRQSKIVLQVMNLCNIIVSVHLHQNVKTRLPNTLLTVIQQASAEPEGDVKNEVEAPNDAAAESVPAVKSTPPKPTNGTVTRQRSGKATPAKPQPPKHAPKPISKAKKGKKGKGKGAAKKVLM